VIVYHGQYAHGLSTKERADVRLRISTSTVIERKLRQRSVVIILPRPAPSMNDPSPQRDLTSPSTSMSLLEQAKIHDRTAWEKLVRLYSPLVYEWCRKSGLPPDAAEVVGQEVFAAVFTSIANFRKDQPGDTFRGWLRRIVQRKRADYIDSAKRQPKAIGGEEAHVLFHALPGDNPDAFGETSEEKFALYLRAIELIQSEFNHVDFAAFIQIVVHERPVKDIATELSISENSVYLAKSRILKHVKGVFNELLPEIDTGNSLFNGLE